MCRDSDLNILALDDKLHKLPPLSYGDTFTVSLDFGSAVSIQDLLHPLMNLDESAKRAIIWRSGNGS